MYFNPEAVIDDLAPVEEMADQQCNEDSPGTGDEDSPGKYKQFVVN